MPLAAARLVSSPPCRRRSPRQDRARRRQLGARLRLRSAGAAERARDITRHGGWRAYLRLARRDRSPPDAVRPPALHPGDLHEARPSTLPSPSASPTRTSSIRGAAACSAPPSPAVRWPRSARRRSCARRPAPKIRIGYWPVAAGLPFFAAIEKGYFKEAGLDVEPLKFAGAQQVMEAMLVRPLRRQLERHRLGQPGDRRDRAARACSRSSPPTRATPSTCSRSSSCPRTARSRRWPS